MFFSLISSTVVTILCGTTHAFHDTRPSFIDSQSVYFVSEIANLPDDYKQAQKQGVLALSNNTQFTSPTESSNGNPSLTSSIQIETMTAGMSYLYSNTENQAFSVNITLNAKDYPVLLDTGSPYLWLYSSNCTDNSCKGKELFNAEQADQLNGTFALSYDSGIASGFIYDDSIIIAGFETQNFEFGVADHVPDLFQHYGFSGVLGLPADNASITGLVNAVSFLSENGDIDSSKFTICMGEYDSDEMNDGLLFMGSTMDTLHSGEIYTSPIIEEAVSHWEFKIDAVYVDDFQMSFDTLEINDEHTNTSRIGLLDSGTTSLILSVKDANTLHSFFRQSITDGENYAILCNETLQFDLEISNKNWSLTPDMYIGTRYPVSSDLEGYCISNIQGIDSNADGAWILGILFMENKYVEFDYENQWIGLAERNNNIKFVNPPKNDNATATTSAIITSTTLATSSISLTSNTVTTSSITSKNSGTRVYGSNMLYVMLSILCAINLN